MTRLMTTLYTPEEREKIEWAIGSIVNGDSKKDPEVPCSVWSARKRQIDNSEHHPENV